MKRKKGSILAAAFAAIALIVVNSDSVLSAPSAFTAVGTPSARIVVQMKALNGSGENGTAVLTQFRKAALVVITLQNKARNSEPAHIHAGTCPRPARDPVIALNDAVSGTSKTFLPGVRINSLLHDSVVVHKSLAKISTYVSCGNIR